jgi:hypothetical protein
MALSTLARHLKKQSGEQQLSGNIIAGESRPIAVEVAAILSVVEICCRLRIPVRESLNEILPGFADSPIRQVADLTPSAWVARHASDNL